LFVFNCFSVQCDFTALTPLLDDCLRMTLTRNGPLLRSNSPLLGYNSRWPVCHLQQAVCKRSIGAVIRRSCDNSNCYNSTHKTCTRLVQITSRDVHKYAIVASSTTTQ